MKKMVFVVSCVAIAIAGVLGVSEFKSEELANCDAKITEALKERYVDGECGGIGTGRSWFLKGMFH